MKAEEMREKFERAMEIVVELKSIDAHAYCSVDIGGSGSRVAFFPDEIFKGAATRLILSKFGKLKKDDSGNLIAENDGLEVTLFGVLKCEIVGYKKVLKEETVKTGNMIEVDQPIYECRSPLSAGKE